MSSCKSTQHEYASTDFDPDEETIDVMENAGAGSQFGQKTVRTRAETKMIRAINQHVKKIHKLALLYLNSLKGRR